MRVASEAVFNDHLYTITSDKFLVSEQDFKEALYKSEKYWKRLNTRISEFIILEQKKICPTN